MAKLIWTDQAIEDLENIGNYIAENSERYARITIEKIFSRTKILESFPQVGRIVPEKNEQNVRELIEGNYRIIYEIIPEQAIYILTVYHSTRELKS